MKRNRGTALLLAVLLCLSMLFSISYLALGAEHEHTEDENCVVCMQLEACVQVLGTAALALVVLAIFAAVALLLCRALPLAEVRENNRSLFARKVKLTI